jgi:sulfonate transport system ATP-binding protein
VDEAVYLSDRVLVMSSRPGRITGEVAVALARDRDRRNPRLARLKAEVLTQLNGGVGDFRDVSAEAGEVRPRQRIDLANFAFAL